MHRHGLLKRFARNEKATVGLMFGLSLVPLMGLTGAAVDYGRSSLLRTEMQAAVDATALALAKDAQNMTPAQRDAYAQSVFNANWSQRFNAQLLSFTVTRTTDRFIVDARARVDNVVMQLVGAPSTEVTTTGSSTWGLSKIEIALVLDNTGSMGWSGKMQELKVALCGDSTCSNTSPTTGFVKTMFDTARTTDQIRIALVPFDVTVRVPLSYQQSVLAGTRIGDSFSAPGSSGYCTSGAITNEARRVRISNSPDVWSVVRFANRDKDTVSNSRNDSGVWVGGGCGTMAGAGTPRITFDSWQNWQGCLWDRDQSAGDRDTRPSAVDFGDITTLHPAVTCRTNALARMMPLVDVRANMATLINALATMQPSGNTNLTIGAAWGTNMLTPNAPISTAIPDEPNLRRFMILLTDGDNTENKRTSNQSDIDARALLACQAAREQGIVIYSVRVIQGNRQLLQDCAGPTGRYYEVSTASQMSAVFQDIARQIGAIRLTN